MTTVRRVQVGWQKATRRRNRSHQVFDHMWGIHETQFSRNGRVGGGEATALELCNGHPPPAVASKYVILE